MKKILLVLEDFAERAFLSTLLKKVGWDVEVAQNEVGINNLVLSFSPDVIIINGFGRKVKGEFLPQKLNSLRKKPLFYLITKSRSLTPEQMEKLNVDDCFNSPIDIKKLFQSLEDRGGIKATSAFQKLSQQRKKIGPEQGEGDSALLDKVKKMKTTAQEELEKASPSKAVEMETSQHVKNSAAEVEQLSQAVKEKWENPQEAMLRAKDKLERYRFSDPERARRNKAFMDENPLPETDRNGLDKSIVAEQVKEFRELEGDPEIEEIDDQRKAFAVAMFELGKKE